MGIEPTCEAWEARNKNLKTLELAALAVAVLALIGKQMKNEIGRIGRSDHHPPLQPAVLPVCVAKIPQ